MTMTREEAREHVNGLISDELTKAPKRVTGHDTYICPLCGNGGGPDGDGICTKDGKHYTCFKGCFSSLDYLDILKRVHNTGSETDIFNLYNLEIVARPRAEEWTQDEQSVSPEPEQQPEADYTEYFKSCHARAGQTGYFSFRGVSPGTVDRFNLGYDPAWRHPKTPNAPPTPRIIIPTGDGQSSYLARATDEKTPKQYEKQKVGAAELFNAAALRGADVPYIFIVEGELDALSVIDAGGQAVALGSTANAEKFLDEANIARPSVTLVLSLDNDEAGQNVQAHIKNELQKIKLSPLEVNISGVYKDPNEAWQLNKERFVTFVTNPRKASYLENHSVGGYLPEFFKTIENASRAQAIPTGFTILDEALDGGLYEGLYILGALSSIGKTSICLQIADQIAQQGTDVLFFSLEMSKFELVTKSMSRLTFIDDSGRNEKGYFYARTNRQIAKFQTYAEREKELTLKAYNEYSGMRNNIFIHEGIGDIGAKQIRESVKEHIDVTGSIPVVFIDYLQILTPYEMRATDKQNTDKAVLELKKMSRDFKAPVFAISSFNRDNYLCPVNMASFKESGAIEYSSDVLLGLQFEGMESVKNTEGKKAESHASIDEMKKRDPRKVELKVLKNRNGATGQNIYFDHYPRFNYFKERVDVSGIMAEQPKQGRVVNLR